VNRQINGNNDRSPQKPQGVPQNNKNNSSAALVRKRKKRRSAVIAAVIVCIAVTCAIIAVILTAVFNRDVPDETKESEILTAEQTNIPETTAVHTTEQDTQTDATVATDEITSDLNDIIETAELPPEEETTEPPETEEVPEPVLYDFEAPVPLSEKVELDYFYDAVFIGDSRTQGLLMYTSLSTKYNYTAQSANVNTLRFKSYITLKEEDGTNKNYTLAEALERENGNYKSIYISSGLNELGWHVTRYIEEYEQLIDTIREITDVPIYIQLITPITTAYEEYTQGALTNAKAALFNERLRLMAAEKEVFVLDHTDLHTLEDGSLDPQYTFDGAHLYSRAYEDVVEYLRTHTVDIEMYDNLRKEPEVEIFPEDSDGVTDETEEVSPEETADEVSYDTAENADSEAA